MALPVPVPLDATQEQTLRVTPVPLVLEAEMHVDTNKADLIFTRKSSSPSPRDQPCPA